LYVIRDQRTSERVLFIAFGLITFLGAVAMLLAYAPKIGTPEADQVRVAAMLLIGLIGLWALARAPQATLKAYRHITVISYGPWPFSLFRKTVIMNSTIIGVKPVQHDPVDFPVGSGVRGERHGSSRIWSLKKSEHPGGVLIVSPQGNYVIGSATPVDAARRLCKIVGLD
jgi:hypothetical protein